MRIGQLRVQDMESPLGICTKIPVFSYRFISKEKENIDIGQGCIDIKPGNISTGEENVHTSQENTKTGTPGDDQRNLNTGEENTDPWQKNIHISQKDSDTSHENTGEKLPAGKAGKQQGAYRILVSSDLRLLEQDQGDLWDSGMVKGHRTSGIVYRGKKLSSRQRYWWKVKAWDEDGNDLGWSGPSGWENGLFPEDWEAEWIGQGDDFSGNKAAAPMFACDFSAALGGMEKARLYVSGLGIFQASLNGKPLADTLFDPGECDATKTVYYVTYDVGNLLREGENTLGILLGNGQYTNFQINPVMRLADGTLLETHRYQKDDGGYVKPGIAGEKKLIVQLEITYPNGKRCIAARSDGSWKWADSPVVFQNWYGGEDYDATMEQPGWDMPGFDRNGWNPAVAMKAPEGKLSGREFPPIRIVERLTPKEVRRTKSGNWLVDMGRNGAGFPEIRLSGTKPEQRGTWLRMYPAELLTADGEHVDQASCTQSWSKWYQCSIRDSYRIKGSGEEIWHPSFCYQGFQYLEIEGYDGELSIENFRYCIVRTDNGKKGFFQSSNKILDNISLMVEHSMESNMFGAFTDCPQIEKLGWIETSHLMFSSLAGTYDIAAWMKKIIHDILDSQIDDVQAGYPGNEGAGYVPAIIPEYQRIVGLNRDPNWNGACIFTPWEYYQYYGDSSVLSMAYPTMKRYISYLAEHLKNGVLEDYAQMGEWGELKESTPKVLVATCSFYRMLKILEEISGMLGEEADRECFEKMASDTKEAFYHHPLCYQDSNIPGHCGTFGNGSQASFGCVLYSNLVPEGKKAEAVEMLVESVKKRDFHLSSGEVGLKQVFTALAENGRNDVVWRMVMNETAPSYRYFAEAGMTTLPEYWNCDELWQGMERSRNHAMMGHVKEWINRYILGIRPRKPGFCEVCIDPWLPEELEWVRGAVPTPYGNISVECRRIQGKVEVQAEIPPGIHAVIQPRAAT